MNLKYLALFILFVFNVASTAVADSGHVDFPQFEQECQHDCHVSSKSNKTENDSHENHPDCCHENHVHYYLNILLEKHIYSLALSHIDYPSYVRSFSTNILEIIKPPLV